jgi:hypothetical protein
MTSRSIRPVVGSLSLAIASGAGFVVSEAGGQWGQAVAVPDLTKLNAGGLAEVEN